MSTLIIGKGLAGLITAIRINEISPYRGVTLVEKKIPQGNSYIAGQRIRAGVAKERRSPIDEVLSLFAKRNEGVVTQAMREFSNLLINELRHWHSMGIPHQDSSFWFGPQWGNMSLSGVARAHSVIDWLTKKALELGVRFIEGEVTSLYREDNKITKVQVEMAEGSACICADTYVLAGGSSTGMLFESTNRNITNPPQLLAGRVGIPLCGATVTMLHPFGMKSEGGETLAGCYETDVLEQSKVFNHHNNRLTRVEVLLQEHKAHYCFPDICRELYECGGSVQIVDELGRTKRAGVSIHYNQLGIQTTDGVSVTGINNLFAVGDASGVSFWTNNKERYPGIGLGNCLVTGAKCARIINKHVNEKSEIEILTTNMKTQQRNICHEKASAFKNLNTINVIKQTLGLVENYSKHVTEWQEAVRMIEKKYEGRKNADDLLFLTNQLISQYEQVAAQGNIPVINS